MIAHAGQVRRIADGQAFVAVATSGCSSCGHLGGCGVGKLAGGRRETLIALPAPNGLAVGESVMLELSEKQLTRAAVRGYLLPAVLLVSGAVLGEGLGAGATAADGFAVLGALVGLAVGLGFARLAKPLSPRLSRSTA